MLKMFKDLINEHGSSTILRERLALFSDKYTVLEKKLSVSKQRCSILETENQKLKSQVKQAREEIKRLKEVIDTYTKKDSPTQLNAVQDKILKYLFEAENDMLIGQICPFLSLNENTVKYHLVILEEYNFISSACYYAGGEIDDEGSQTYAIDQKGREYIIENKTS